MLNFNLFWKKKSVEYKKFGRKATIYNRKRGGGSIVFKVGGNGGRNFTRRDLYSC